MQEEYLAEFQRLEQHIKCLEEASFDQRQEVARKLQESAIKFRTEGKMINQEKMEMEFEAQVKELKFKIEQLTIEASSVQTTHD